MKKWCNRQCRVGFVVNTHYCGNFPNSTVVVNYRGDMPLRDVNQRTIRADEAFRNREISPLRLVPTADAGQRMGKDPATQAIIRLDYW